MLQRIAFPAVVFSIAAVVAACDSSGQRPPEAERISEPVLHDHIATLASDDFEGRAAGTEGGRKTVDYLVRAFQGMDLAPGNEGRYTQTVPLVESRLQSPGPVTLRVDGNERSLAYGEAIQYWSPGQEETVTIDDSELVFVGYGTVAPEYDWNDYEGVDVSGKTVVMLVNDPGFATGDPALFDGRAMTRYGRWTYKYAEAARQGARGAILIHETDAAGYGWDVVSGSWSGPQYRLDKDGETEAGLAMASWMSRDAAAELFTAAGTDLVAAKESALADDFRARSLPASVSVTMRQTFESSRSDNVLAYVPGRSRPDEVIIYLAHWDHLGRAEEEDVVHNGAVDNATGTAAVLSIAEAFAAMDPAPERSVMFLLTTAEEQGLLGSEYYAANPVFPLAETVAAINMDSMNFFGATRDLTVVGKGRSELEAYLSRTAEAAGRELRPEDHPERGSFFRSDHFSLASVGVPALYPKPGTDHLERGEDYGQAQLQAYQENRYHQPADEYDPDWDLSGLVADARLLFHVGWLLSATETFPEWLPESEFRSIREESRSADAAE